MHKFTSKHFTSYGVSFKHQTLFSWDFEINYLNSPFFSSHLLKLQDNQIKHHSLIANVCFPVLWGTQQTYSFQQTNSDGALSESSLKCNEGKARKKIFKKKKKSYMPYISITAAKVEHIINVHRPSGQDRINK